MMRLAGVALIVVSSIFAAMLVMRAIGRFLIFLVVDQPEIGAGFLLGTFASSALGITLAWHVGKKGLSMVREYSVSTVSTDTDQNNQGE